jgi:hypothetical protein
MKTDPETEATAYAVGTGIVLIQVFALFPGALACLLLLVPLLLPPLLLGLIVAPFYGLWKLGKWALTSRGGSATAPYATGELARQA